MKFLIIAALVAVAAADYHDDVFHFSSLGSASGLQKTAFLQAPTPVLTKKYATVQQSLPVYSSVVAQPAYRQQYTVSQVAAPLIVKQALPVYTQIAQPAVYRQQYSNAASYASAPKWRILSQIHEVDPAGPYKVSYNTENGIQVAEQGALVASPEGPVVAAQGSYSYTGPDGVAYSVSYIADENGFRAAGDHLPTPPPIPAEILKSLEENARSGERYDDQGRLFRK